MKGNNTADIEEIAPGQFLIRELRARPILKGEGEIKGQLFILGTWRREGLIARLRERALSVLTLQDQIDDLPKPPYRYELGDQLWHPITTTHDHVSRFDIQQLAWRPIEVMQRGTEHGIVLYEAEPIRRRKGRGRSSFYTVRATRSGSNLTPINETQALLWGYALAVSADPRPLLAERKEQAILLPEIELPPPYRKLLQRIIGQHKERPRTNKATWPLVQVLYAQLGVRLVLEQPKRRGAA